MEINRLCLGCMEERGEQKMCPHCGWAEGSTTPSSRHLPAGTLLNEKYLVGRPFGQGSLGVTYLAWDINLGLKLSVREYQPRKYASRAPGKHAIRVQPKEGRSLFERGLEIFLGEARILARFEGQPGIVSVRDFFEANGTAYVVTNCLEGLTLEGFLDRVGKLSFRKTAQMLMPLMDALKEVHAAGLFHRDISPVNIFITGTGRAVLIDFAGARHAVGDISGNPEALVRTGFAPEEQYHAPERQGPWTDIYALAATIYRAITGEAPPDSRLRLAEDNLAAPSRLGVKIGEKEEHALLKALAVRAADRFQAIQDFQAILLEGMPG